jgi:hypothetical protein
MVSQWQALPGRTYQVEYKDDLDSVAWLPLDEPITGPGGSVSVTNTVAAPPQRFFRLNLLP